MRLAAEGPSPLSSLAAAHGVANFYKDAFGDHHQVSETTLVAVLAAMGVPIEEPGQAALLLRAEVGNQQVGQVPLPPVVAAWDGALEPLVLGPPEIGRAISIALVLEDGSSGDDLLDLRSEPHGSVLSLRGPLPLGLHQLLVDRPSQARGAPLGAPSRLQGEPDEITIIAAPRRLEGPERRGSGVFCPAYGLWSKDGGSGDLSQLRRLGTFVAGKEIGYLSTLPLLADDPGKEPSPYSPLSRLFWYEGYIDPAGLPELAFVMQGAEPPSGPGQRAEFLRPHLAAAEELLYTEASSRLAAYEKYLDRRPEVLSYARFRAARENMGPAVASWPERWRHGLVEEAELDPTTLSAHRYAQFAFESQLGELSKELAASSCQLMLDLPIGCRGDGYDPWAFPDAFAHGVRIGAPPDRFFTGGQDWGFPPLIPERERSSGYAVTRACLSNLLRHTGALRIDHALGFSRLWWIPEGFGPTEGAYVSYPTDELLALFCLEAARENAYLVGEDLGTVEEELVSALRAHGVAGMQVAVFDLESSRAHPMEPLDPPAGTVAMVDTHDTATLAGWLSGKDIADRLGLGLLSTTQAETELAERKRNRRVLVDRLYASGLLSSESTEDPVAIHAGLLEELGGSEADLVMVNLEDCWGETDPQNVPGTTEEHANFQRRLALCLDEIETDSDVSGTLARLTCSRRSPRAIASDDGGY